MIGIVASTNIDAPKYLNIADFLMIWRNGAGEGDRTLDTELGKLVLYH